MMEYWVIGVMISDIPPVPPSKGGITSLKSPFKACARRVGDLGGYLYKEFIIPNQLFY